jgi:hypothetical protein
VTLASSGGTGAISYSGDAITGLTTGSYSYTATDANGCTATTSAAIANPSAITFTASATQPTCSYNTGSVSLASSGGTGAISYSGDAITGLTTGSYSYTATDANGCTATTTITVALPAALTLAWNDARTDFTNMPSCSNIILFGYDTALSVAAAGGTPSYSYTWSAGSSTTSSCAMPSAMPSTYSVTVTDVHGCIASVQGCVVDVTCKSGGGGANKLSMCKKGHTICVPENNVANLLALGATIGACGSWRQSDTSGVDNIAGADLIKVYPNPTAGAFTLVSEEAGTLNVFSIDGKEITGYEIKAGINALSLPKELASGIYICRYTSENGSTTMVRLVYE